MFTRHIPKRLVLLVTIATLLATPVFAEPADDRSAASLLPETSVLYAHVVSPPALLAAVLDHPLREKVEAMPPYQAAMESDEYKQFQFILGMIEMQLGTKWRPAVESLTAGGLTVALDAESEGVALLIRGDDEELMTKARDLLLQMVRSDAEDKGKSDPVRSVEYRGIEAHRIGKLRLAVFGPWLVATNNSEFGRAILDNYLDEGNKTLAKNERFQKAVATQKKVPTPNPSSENGGGGSGIGSPGIWAYADVATIRAAGVAAEILGGRAEDPAAELILGGVLGTLHKTPYATASLDVIKSGLRLTVSTPHDSAWIPAERSFFFGPNHRSAAPPAINLPGTLLTIRAHRDIAGMWLHAPDLFDDDANAELAKTNSDLSTLFGGREFGEEILGALGGGVQIIVAENDFEASDRPTPAIRLPAVAFLGTLKDPQATQRSLRIAFQTLVGFVNLTGAEEGRPPLELDTDRADGVVILSAAFAQEDMTGNENGAKMDAAPMRFNFTPTVAFVNDHIVVSSARGLAEKAAARLQNLSQNPKAPTPNPSSATADLRPEDGGGGLGSDNDLTDGPVVNTIVEANVPAIRKALTENRQHLIAQNMLEKGHARAAAENEIDTLLSILDWLQSGEVQLRVENDALTLEVNVAVVKE